MKIQFWKNKKIKDFLTINLGIFLLSSAFGIFVDPNEIVVGGVGGIGTLVKSILKGTTIWGIEIRASMIIFIINMILLLFAFLFVGKSFFLKTVYASIVYPLFISLWEIIFKLMGGPIINLPAIEQNLIAIGLSIDTIHVIMAGAYLVMLVFGGVLSGIGLGLAMKKGASTGGVDIIQQILLDKFKIPFSASLFIVDGTVVTLATLYYQNIFIILYGFLYIYLSGVVLDAVAFSGFHSRAVYIITKEPKAIKNAVYRKLGRGVTEIYSRGGYEMKDSTMLVCVMSNSEYYRIKSMILEIDPRAFIYVERASEVHGEGFSYDSPEGCEETYEI